MGLSLINGRNYDYLQMTALYKGIPIPSLSEITYSETQEKENTFGQGNRPVGRGHGAIDASGSMTISMTDAEALRAVAPNRSLLELEADDFVLIYANTGNVPRTHTLKNLEFTEDPGGGAQNDKDLLLTLPFIISHVEKA